MGIPERQIAFFKDMFVIDDSQVRYDLYFTDKRLLVINLGKKSQYTFLGGGVIGGLVSEGMYAIESKRKGEQLKKKEEK